MTDVMPEVAVPSTTRRKAAIAAAVWTLVTAAACWLLYNIVSLGVEISANGNNGWGTYLSNWPREFLLQVYVVGGLIFVASALMFDRYLNPLANHRRPKYRLPAIATSLVAIATVLSGFVLEGIDSSGAQHDFSNSATTFVYEAGQIPAMLDNLGKTPAQFEMVSAANPTLIDRLAVQAHGTPFLPTDPGMQAAINPALVFPVLPDGTSLNTSGFGAVGYTAECTFRDDDYLPVSYDGAQSTDYPGSVPAIGSSLRSKMKSAYPSLSNEPNDVYCDTWHGHSTLFVPMQREVGILPTHRVPAGVMVIQGSASGPVLKLYRHVTHGQLPGNVYPRSLAIRQLHASLYAIGNHKAHSLDWGVHPSADFVSAGYFRHLLQEELPQFVPSRLGAVTLVEASKRWSAHGLAVMDLSRVDAGKLNPLRIYVTDRPS